MILTIIELSIDKVLNYFFVLFKCNIYYKCIMKKTLIHYLNTVQVFRCIMILNFNKISNIVITKYFMRICL